MRLLAIRTCACIELCSGTACVHDDPAREMYSLRQAACCSASSHVHPRMRSRYKRSHALTAFLACRFPMQAILVGGAELYRNTELDPELRIYPGGELQYAVWLGKDRVQRDRQGMLILTCACVWVGGSMCVCSEWCFSREWA